MNETPFALQNDYRDGRSGLPEDERALLHVDVRRLISRREPSLRHDPIAGIVAPQRTVLAGSRWEPRTDDLLDFVEGHRDLRASGIAEMRLERSVLAVHRGVLLDAGCDRAALLVWAARPVRLVWAGRQPKRSQCAPRAWARPAAVMKTAIAPPRPFRRHVPKRSSTSIAAWLMPRSLHRPTACSELRTPSAPPPDTCY